LINDGADKKRAKAMIFSVFLIRFVTKVLNISNLREAEHEPPSAVAGRGLEEKPLG